MTNFTFLSTLAGGDVAGSNGHAGVGRVIEAAASANGLAFVPLAIEHVDLITFRRDAFEPPLANAAGVYAHA